MLTLNDLNQVQKDQSIQQRINELSNDIRILKSKYAFPNDFRGLVVGSAAGMMFGGLSGAAIGAGVGYFLGKKNQIEQTDKEIIANQIKKKQEELNILLNKKQVLNKDSLTPAELNLLNTEAYNFDGEFLEFFGKPEKPFHCIVHGLPKNGKSRFSCKFAKYLSNFGNVLYDAAEEGFGLTLKNKVDEFGLNSNRIKFTDKKSLPELEKIIKDVDFLIIDSINYSKISVEDVERLKNQNPKLSLITIHQSTKDGKMRGSQEYMHNCDMVVEVISCVAYQKGRFNAGGEMKV